MKLRLISDGEHKDAFGTHKWKTYAQIPTNFDKLRSMSIEEIENWFWWTHEEIMWYTDSRVFLHNWLRQEAKDGNNQKI